jgi:hypothetical protein
MRSLKLGAIAAITAVAAIGALRATELITAPEARWLGGRALAVIALLLVAGIATSLFAGRTASATPDDRPIP